MSQPSWRLVGMSWDPVTRIVGSLGIHTRIDFEKREVVDCYSTSSIFRGYRVFMKGKDPRDAHFISSGICGICGDNHATCACYTQNMAFGVNPPVLADWIINLGEAAEFMVDHNLFQDNLVGVVTCEKMVPEVAQTFGLPNPPAGTTHRHGDRARSKFLVAWVAHRDIRDVTALSRAALDVWNDRLGFVQLPT